MGDAQGKFTPGISEPSIMQWLSLTRADPCRLLDDHPLALETGSRFLSSRQQHDLEHTILSLTEAIYLPHTRDTPSPFPNIVHTFYFLTLSLSSRANQLRRPEDVKSCIRYFRYLHRQWHEISMKFLVPVTTALVHALAVQVDLDVGDVDQDIEEMAGLCDELLNSNISLQSLTDAIADFARAISVHFKDVQQKGCSEKVTDCLRKATVRLPSLHQVSIVLTLALYDRFVVAPSDDDYEEAMVTLDRILTFRRSGDGPSPYRKEVLRLAAMFAYARFNAYGKPEHFEHAIYRFRILLDAMSIGDPDRANIIKRLSDLEQLRFDGTPNTQDALSIPPKSAKLPSFRDLIASLPDPMAIKAKSVQTSGKHIDALKASYINQLTDVANIEDGIKYCRHLLVLYPRSQLASAAQFALVGLLHRAFERTHEIEYLNEAISATRDAINTTIPLHSRVAFLVRFTSFLSARLELLHREEDLHELMQLFPTVADYSVANLHDQHPISFHWAIIARRF